MKEEKNITHGDYSIDEILAEEKVRRERETKTEKSAPPKQGSQPAAADDIVRSAHEALNMEAGCEPPAPPEKKKKKHSFFHRGQETEDAVPEDDIYYGLQLKSLEEYRREYEETIRFDTRQLREAEQKLRRKESAENPSLAAPEPQPAGEPEKPAEKPKPTEKVQDIPLPKPSAPAPMLSTPPAEERRAQATAVSAASEGGRQDRLEQILRHVGLDTEDVSAFDDMFAKPERPGSVPPKPSEGVSVPGVIPGPPLEPPHEPPSGKPAPMPAPTAETAPISAPLSASEASFKPEFPTTPEISPRPTTAPTPEILPRPETEPTPQTEPRPVILPDPEAVPEPEETPEQEPPVRMETEETPPTVKEPVSPPTSKDQTPPPPQVKEPLHRPVPTYRAETLPLHVIELNVFDDALAAEAAGYAVPPMHAPEPIPFPSASKTEQEEEAAPEAACKTAEAPAQPENEPGNTRIFRMPERAPKAGEPSKGKKHFRIFGNDEDPTQPDDLPDDTEEELDDYTAPGDAPSVMNDLTSKVRRLFLRFTVTGIFSLILVAFSVAWEHPAVLPAELHSIYTVQGCLVVQLIFLSAAAAFCLPTIVNGLRGLFSFQANTDSAVAVATLAALAENIVFLCSGFPEKCHLYSALAVCALFLNTAGKLSMSRRILRNFRFLTSPEQKYAVQMFDDYNTAIRMTKDCVPGEPKIAYQTTVGFLRHFLKHSYAPDPGEHVSQFLAPAGFIGSLALCIIAAVRTQDAAFALTAFTAAACVCVPFGGLLGVNLPLARLSSIASRCGGMAVGWDAVEAFSDTNAVMLDAQDLFPRGTVVLNGIQTFEGQRIDDAILDATALTAAVGGPLSDLFSQIVKTRGETLPHVKRPVYEEGLGVSGTVSERIILVGNGELLKRHGVDAPSHDYEEKYLRSGKIPVYLAAGGTLVAMFLVFYRSDRRRAAELRRMEFNGISLLVRTRDPNITPELIAGCFGLSPHSVTILPEKLGEVYASLQAHPPERAAAVIATRGRATAMMRLLTACARQRGNIAVGVALQAAGAALGFALVAFFTGCSGLAQLSDTALLLFEAFWTAAAIFIPRIRRP